MVMSGRSGGRSTRHVDERYTKRSDDEIRAFSMRMQKAPEFGLLTGAP